MPITRTTISRSISSSAGDWEKFGGTGSDDLEFGIKAGKAQVVGLRFSDLDIPDGAVIERAYLQFQAEETSSGAANLRIHAENASGGLLGASVAWNGVAPWNAGTSYKSADVSSLLRGVLAGDADADSFAFRITGTGSREAYSFDSNGRAPKLVVTYADDSDSTPTPTPAPAPIPANPGGGMSLKVWLGHDGYADPDDNLAMLVGAAQAKAGTSGDASVSLRGFIYGDTVDGGQYLMLNPDGRVPSKFSWQSKFSDGAISERAAGNYAFYQKYGSDAVAELAPGLKQYNLLAADNGGNRAWNFNPSSESDVTAASRALAADIKAAIGKTGNEMVVYSAGGGANVAAEAIALLGKQGVSSAKIMDHFVIVQHSGSNWANQYEARTAEITRKYTVAISDQNFARYPDGSTGPGLKEMFANGMRPTGSNYGDEFELAFAVATGKTKFVGLKYNQDFVATHDASDAGSHAFAVDKEALLGALDERMSGRESLQNSLKWAMKITAPTYSDIRERVHYDDFNARDALKLLGDDLLF